MPHATVTGKKTPRSSLCNHVSFSVPVSWEQLSQKQLHHVLKLYCLFGSHPSGLVFVKMSALTYFCGFEPLRNTDAGWVCRLRESGRTFILDSGLLPSMEAHLSWLEHPEDMTVRLEEVGGYKAANMWLQKFPFGNYLALENHYQNYLQTHEDQQLDRMMHLLYDMPLSPYLEIRVPPYVLLSVFFWFTAVKKRFSKTFPHFLKPVAGGQQTGTFQTQFELTQMQIRLLTKGDVTRYQQVLDSDTWQALYELDAQARDSEEFNRKYGKNNV